MQIDFEHSVAPFLQKEEKKAVNRAELVGHVCRMTKTKARQYSGKVPISELEAAALLQFTTSL